MTKGSRPQACRGGPVTKEARLRPRRDLRAPGRHRKVSLRIAGFGEWEGRSGHHSIHLSKGCAGKKGRWLELAAVSAVRLAGRIQRLRTTGKRARGAPVHQVHKGERGNLS